MDFSFFLARESASEQFSLAALTYSDALRIVQSDKTKACMRRCVSFIPVSTLMRMRDDSLRQILRRLNARRRREAVATRALGRCTRTELEPACLDFHVHTPRAFRRG